MIRLERMNGTELWLNPVHIESVEPTPDTVITLTNGHKYLVRQDAESVAELVRVFLSTVGIVGSYHAEYGGRKAVEGDER